MINTELVLVSRVIPNDYKRLVVRKDYVLWKSKICKKMHQCCGFYIVFEQSPFAFETILDQTYIHIIFALSMNYVIDLKH